MGLNIPRELRDQLSVLMPAPWEDCVTYLGIRLIGSMDIQALIDLNLKPLIQTIRQQLEQWRKLRAVRLSVSHQAIWKMVTAHIFPFASGAQGWGHGFSGFRFTLYYC